MTHSPNLRTTTSSLGSAEPGDHFIEMVVRAPKPAFGMRSTTEHAEVPR